MATYCIGDVHGCYNELKELLCKIEFNVQKDYLIFTGDLIGRGPYPDKTLDLIMSFGDHATATLGNHDVNFLAVEAGIVKSRAKDNLEVLLNSQHRHEYVQYLCSLPFLHVDKQKQLAVCHAGLYPLWSFADAKRRAKELSAVLKDDVKRQILLLNMYGNTPEAYVPGMQGLALWRFTLNAFTRMRLCDAAGTLDFKNSAIAPSQVKDQGLYPWFDLGDIGRGKNKQYTVVFGHWAALGAKCQKEHVIALDTGCVWGDRLSAWRYDDDRIFSVKSVGYSEIKNA